MKTANTIAGKVYVAGDDIDTDQIIPAKYLNLVPTIAAEYAKLGTYALSGLPAECPPFVKPGQPKSDCAIIVAGRNFGCGSSREHAPIALGAAGTRAIVAQSYARIFFRNTVATGEFYPLETPARICDQFQTGDEAEIDLKANRIVNRRTGKTFDLKAPGAVAEVIANGGLFGHARKTGMIGKK
jgi:3-isopropylmalate/(R)-2-methylmalate dehydratase small subunit